MIDPLETAKAELAAAMVLTPEDLLQDVGPFAQLYFAEQATWVALRTLTAMLADQEETGTAETDEVGAAVLQSLSMATGMLDVACVGAGLLPPEAIPQEQ